MEILKVPKSFPKMERLSNEPHRVLLCRVPSGDKTFSSFQKGRWKMGFLKVSKPFPNTIKWKDRQMDHIGFCFAESLRSTSALRALIGVWLSLDHEGRKMVLGDTRLPVLFLTVLIPRASIFPSFSQCLVAFKNLSFLKA